MKKSFGAKTLVFPTKGHVDIGKVKPILFAPEINTYQGVGRLQSNLSLSLCRSPPSYHSLRFRIFTRRKGQ